MRLENPNPSRRRLRKSNPVAKTRATVIGLGGVGRQVAVLLASLGVRRLQLVGGGIVARTTQATQGFAQEDIGRPQIFAAAQACHQIRPRLDVITVNKRSVRDLDFGGAVFLCSGSKDNRKAIGQAIGTACRFCGRCVVIGVTVHIDTAWDRQSLAGWSEHVGETDRPPGLAAAAVPMAAIAAGMVVAEFVRFAPGHRPNRSIGWDMAQHRPRND